MFVSNSRITRLGRPEPRLIDPFLFLCATNIPPPVVVDDLVPVERENADLSDLNRPAALICRPNASAASSSNGISYSLHAAAIRIHIRALTKDMHHDHARGKRFRLARSFKALRRRLDRDSNLHARNQETTGRAPKINNRIGGGDKCKRGAKDLVSGADANNRRAQVHRCRTALKARLPGDPISRLNSSSNALIFGPDGRQPVRGESVMHKFPLPSRPCAELKEVCVFVPSF